MPGVKMMVGNPTKHDQIFGKLREQLVDQLRRQIREQLYGQLYWQLYDQLSEIKVPHDET